MDWFEEERQKGFVELRPKQREAMEKLRSGCILCGGTGSGKSITSLAFYYTKICQGIIWNDGWLGPMLDSVPLYIITTARKRDEEDWVDEADRFDIGDTLKAIDSWNNIEKYRYVEDAFFIFDEQRVCGKGKWARTFERIAKHNRWILLSATPGDKWTDYISVFVANGFYRNQSEFMFRHAIYDRYVTKYPKITGFREKAHLERLRRSITVLMEVDRDTDRHFEDIPVPYDREKYDIIWKKRFNPWTEEPIQDISGACYLMRRAANSARYIFTDVDGESVDVDARAYEILKLCMEKHERIVIFYNFDYELEAMRETFEWARQTKLFGKDSDFCYAEWNGHRHEPLPKAKRWVYMVQYSSGCEGWNCVQTNALVYYSMSYSYKQTEQAAGRIDRLNTPFVDLYYYILKSEAPIDRAIEKALENKRDFNEAIFWDKET